MWLHEMIGEYAQATIEMLILCTWTLTHSGMIAINIYIYAQYVVRISVEKFVSVGEFVRPLCYG